MLSLTVHYIIDIIFSIFFVHFIFIYILFSVVHMSLVKQCIFLCTLRSICYVRIKIIIISAKNALNNVYGCSPNQLVFGRNPSYPAVYSDKPPAQNQSTIGEHVLRNLQALHYHVSL